MYQVLSNNRVRKMPEMEIPKYEDFDSEKGYEVTRLTYEAEMLRQPIYPIFGNHNWKVGQLIPDDEIEIRDEDGFTKGNYMNHCAVCKKEFSGADKLWFLCHEHSIYQVAIPKQTEPSTGSEEDELNRLESIVHAFNTWQSFAVNNKMKYGGFASTNEILDFAKSDEVSFKTWAKSEKARELLKQSFTIKRIDK